MSNNRLCACQCGGVLRNKGKFLPGHNQVNAHLWRSKLGKGDTRKGMKKSTTIIYERDGEVAAPDPFEMKELADWQPQPDEWYEARVEKPLAGALLLRLTNNELVFAHRSVMPPNFKGPLASVRIERSDRGVKWRALQVLP